MRTEPQISEQRSPLILRVAIPIPLRKLFDYQAPLDPVIIPVPGMRVLVPFGSQKKIGVIVAVLRHSEYPLKKIKYSEAILDPVPLFPTAILELIQWVSQYYQSAIGEVFEAALPAKLRKLEKTKERKKISFPEIKSTQDCVAPLLNPEQKQALSSITHSFGKFKTFVLDGVTGSGKTEVYMRVVEAILATGKQALILIPEIGLTPQLLKRFQDRFQVPIAVLNSSLSEKQRYLAFENARTGAAPIVMGTRLSAFTPLKSPGIFIIDEEHDTSFKQQEGLRYHARDVIILRASLEHCPVVLGTATPALETLRNLQNGRFHHLVLANRAGNAQLPHLEILDIRHNKLQEGLSAQLISIMREHLENGGQILLFLNRRGYSPVLMCFECEWIATCKNCDAKLTLHYQSQTLRCHHCESDLPLYQNCPTCAAKNPKPVGFGTERLEAALAELFPKEHIVRIDRDTTRKKGSLKEQLNRIQEGEANILLGTQMISKGHHFPKLSLVAILDIDQALFSTDFRSTEKMGQLITQVAGRAGRAENLGHVILQTQHPNHPLIRQLLREGYSKFAGSLLAERQMLNLPPFSYQVLIRSEGNSLESSLGFLTFLKKTTLQYAVESLKISGPIPAPMERRKGKYRAQLLLQASKRSILQAVLQKLIPHIESAPNMYSVKWSLDVDPLEMQ